MDYKVLLRSFEQTQDMRDWPRQRVIHACLRGAILGGSLTAGTRLLPSRVLADELGIARNTVLYAYDQLATEGLVRATPRGTLVAPLNLPAKAPAGPAKPPDAPLARRTQAVRALPTSSDDAGAFSAGIPALDAFPIPLWRRTVDRVWR